MKFEIGMQVRCPPNPRIMTVVSVNDFAAIKTATCSFKDDGGDTISPIYPQAVLVLVPAP